MIKYISKRSSIRSRPSEDRGAYLAEHLLCGSGGSVGSQDGASGGVHPLDDEVVEHHLLLGALQDVLLHRVAGQEAVDVDSVLLPDAVSATHCLEIVLRVPARPQEFISVYCFNSLITFRDSIVTGLAESGFRQISLRSSAENWCMGRLLHTLFADVNGFNRVTPNAHGAFTIFNLVGRQI